ncbi:hypothetical protein RB195_021502 [Necator americanus]|uniref:CC domain-containing protein n=1 Tax=Necator americanus TaxID=51031 RepID=A0ABR1EDE7_NECAM
MNRFLIAFLTAAFLIVSAQRQDLLSHAVGPCIDGRCQPGHVCYLDNCIPQRLISRGNRAKRAFDLSTAIGPCIDNRCPAGYVCRQQQCLRQ